MSLITPPDIVRLDRPGFPFEPSWSGPDSFLNQEHRDIYEATRDLPGWQDPADSEKLYEMAYHCGGVILEIGVFGGRSAVVELRGAMAAHRQRGGPYPQLYGVDIDVGAFYRAPRTSADALLTDRSLFFHGDLARFLRDIPIVPTMVFVDGDHRYAGCWADLGLLADWLEPGTPVMCHDYGGIPGVARAVDEWIAAGAYTRMGRFAGSMLLRAVGKGWRAGATSIRAAPSRGLGLSPGAFESVRDGLLKRYAAQIRHKEVYTPVRDLTEPARLELRGAAWPRLASGRATWPYAAPLDQPALPPTMPGGLPWPKISIVTPSFNQGRYIEEMLLSVRNQGYPNAEHIVMDGGSTDGTMEVVERYRDGLAHARSAPDDGQSDAINRGMAFATGEILTWLNSDDMLAPGALAAMAMAFRTSGADIVAGECHVYRDGVQVSRHLTSCADGPLPLEALLDIEGRWLEGQFFYQPEVMFTREIWEKAGGHVRTDLYHSMDYELWLRMADAGARLHVIGRPVALFRAHPEQKTAGEVGGGFRAELPGVRAAFLERTGRAGMKIVPRPPARRHRLRITLYNDLGYAFGAGIAHRRIAEAFLALGNEVSVIAAASDEIHGSAPRTAIEDTLARIAATRPDLVVMGNLHGADLHPDVLEAIASRFPTAFILHDLWLLTGRCAYTGGCRQYLHGCGDACTCDKSHPRLAPELVAPMWAKKRAILRNAPELHLWANSDWARGKVQEALGADPAQPPVAPIRFGLELDIFRPLDKASCRAALGLPQDRFIIMSSASSLADPRKGLKHLADALELLKLSDALVACVGWFDSDEQPPIPGMRAMGYTKDPAQLAMLYAAADVFVGPSLEEAFGQVYIEAAACGTPSVGYPVDGKPEAICEGVSGLLAAKVEPAGLAAAIEELYENRARREAMGRWARLWVENEFSLTASAHHLFCAMRRQGLVARFGLPPRHELAIAPRPAPEPQVVEPTLPAWRSISGFDAWEGPYPDRKIPRSRWAHGPSARFEVTTRAGGRLRLLLTCRCWHDGQRVRLMCGPTCLGEHAIDAALASERGCTISFEGTLKPGRNELELHFWKWNLSGRPLAILVSGISVVGEGPGPVVEIPPPLTVRRAVVSVEAGGSAEPAPTPSAPPPGLNGEAADPPEVNIARVQPAAPRTGQRGSTTHPSAPA
jgi:glycosyltransferase involved in cell wall biosynthesis